MPQKCIVTCSTDKKIIMYSLIRGDILRIFPQHNKTSVRKMVYFEDYGRYLLSAGSEQDIYVWAVDNIVDDPLYGRLGGHKKPVCDMFAFPR